MQSYTAIVEKCPDTGLYVGYTPYRHNLSILNVNY